MESGLNEKKNCTNNWCYRTRWILSIRIFDQKYIVHGIIRKSSSFNTSRIDHIYQSPNVKKRNFFLHYGDLSDASNLSKIIESVLPDEIYNLAAQSHVGTSFNIPEYTSNINALGPLRILEIIKSLSNKKNKILSSIDLGTLWNDKSKKTK